jgi:hypothetical protein
MSSSSVIGITSALLFLGSGTVTWGQAQVPRNHPKELLRIYFEGTMLGVFDGALAFSAGVNESTAGQREPHIAVMSSYFHDPGDGTLRIYVLPDEKGIVKAHDSLDGMYLTADYSITPPQVLLSKAPEKYSKWIIERENRFKAYIRNENDLGKDAWLYWGEPMGPAIRLGESMTQLRRPILSYEKKLPFDAPIYRGPEAK